MELHRSNPQCASCHQQMDPLGFALENYDAIGRFRTTDGDFPVDPSGELIGGRKFADVKELKQLLKSTGATKFARCLVENMLTYALGRGLEAYDYCTVDDIRTCWLPTITAFATLFSELSRVERFSIGALPGNDRSARPPGILGRP